MASTLMLGSGSPTMTPLGFRLRLSADSEGGALADMDSGIKGPVCLEIFSSVLYIVQMLAFAVLGLLQVRHMWRRAEKQFQRRR